MKGRSTSPGSKRGSFLPSLFIGDAVTVIIFTLLGMIEHGTTAGMLSVLVTATPFLIAWIGVGLWLGVFWEHAVTGIGTAMRRILVPWVLSIPIAMQLRVLLLGRGAPLAFALVSLALGGICLIVWRTLYTWIRLRTGKMGIVPTSE